ncbi:hypothetical protein TNIN_360431 [Trichonephila inaurata madagascariensis]|uniref:Uncharacterized protein n=1 Tax=Trichonephila inaurata madagascariensis TaxID=2747483 RepID=A0A8X6M8F8_9ARAC|nr:hypothetical protein TNIN_360431 [Trichonephila inaurata madagascariensis]
MFQNEDSSHSYQEKVQKQPPEITQLYKSKNVLSRFSKETLQEMTRINRPLSDKGGWRKKPIKSSVHHQLLLRANNSIHL